MKSKKLIFAVALVLFVSRAAFADRELDRNEILQIFQELTSQPRKTWIPAGTIEATHEEYKAPETTDPNEIYYQINEKIQEYQNDQNKIELIDELQKFRLDAIPFNVRYRLSNKYTMSSDVVVRFDGERFYWQINVNSRMDSVKPEADLEGNFMTEQFNLDWNAKRIFAWDGEKYTTYFLSGNHAIVDTTGDTPQVVNGPLTAGFIPWGYGYYSYENLVAADSSAVERYIDGQIQIELTINNQYGPQMVFALDPEKDYAATSCSIINNNNVVISKQYSNYQQVSSTWIPTAISLERYEAGSNRLLARDLWDIIVIDANVPGIESFDVSHETDAVIEYRSLVTDAPAIYRNSGIADTEQLLADRLAFTANEGLQPQNCATAALKYVLGQLGEDVTDSQLAELVTEPDQETSLYAMKEFVQGLGLYSRAVITDIQVLKNLDGCEAILHIPGKNHFVVLEGVDNEYVWIIDLAKDEFYYRTDINFFGMDWTEGIALLISGQPIELQDNFAEIDDTQLQSITGSVLKYYKCTRLLQEYNVIYCTYIAGECLGMYQEFQERYGCEPAQNGSCNNRVMLRFKESPCINDPYDPYNCTITGEWTSYYMLACR
ncbi:MAG: cysteine peptidase family C39 domain-containing protein [Planctomycetota bacterium]|jgi:hypothetical protein